VKACEVDDATLDASASDPGIQTIVQSGEPRSSRWHLQLFQALAQCHWEGSQQALEVAGPVGSIKRVQWAMDAWLQQAIRSSRYSTGLYFIQLQATEFHLLRDGCRNCREAPLEYR